MLALFKALGELCLGGELPHVTVLVEETQDLPLKAVGIRGKWRYRQIIRVCCWVELIG